MYGSDDNNPLEGRTSLLPGEREGITLGAADTVAAHGGSGGGGVYANTSRQLKPPQTIIVMRHGERRDGFVDSTPESNPPLTDRGLASVSNAAGDLAKIVKDISLRDVQLVVSPFLRTLQTAMELQKNGIGSTSKLVVDNHLCEVYGPTRIKTKGPPQLPEDVVMSGCGNLPQWGETIDMAAKRFVRALRENSVRFPESNLLLVSHGDAISAVVDAVKPGYIVYETEYLSFVVLRRKGEQESALNSNRVFDLVTANGVQWLATQPEVSGDASVVSDHHDVSPQLPSDRIMDNPSGDLDNVPASSVNVRSLNTTTFIGVRVLVVASQIPAIEFWAVKANALTYVFAVTLLELIFVAINIFAELRPTILGTLARIEYFPAPRSNDYLALGEPNNRRRNPLSMVILLTAAALRSCITVIFAMLVFFVEDILSQTEFRLCAFIHEIFSWPLGIFLLGMLFWLNIVRMSFCVPRLLKREFGSR